MIQIGDQELRRISDYVQANFGIKISEKKNLVEGRLANILMERGIDSFDEYFQIVVTDKTGEEVALLMERLTTNHTYFMREVSHFEYFKDTVLPWLSEVASDRDIRIWSAGCSSGEEPYTLAMIMADYFRYKGVHWDTRILATDISSKVLSLAREGIYSGEEIRTLPRSWQSAYFKPLGKDRFQIAQEIRDQVIFRSFNLMEPLFPFKKPFHGIFCRNVMIYFEQETKNQLVSKYFKHTVPGGYLFIGHSESLSKDAMGYKYVMPSVYRKGH